MYKIFITRAIMKISQKVSGDIQRSFVLFMIL